MADVRGFDAEAARNVGIAATWGVTIMVTDILKISLSAVDKRARLLFKAQDQAIDRARKVMKLLGMRTPTTRDELIKSVDPKFQAPSRMAQDVRNAQKLLKELGVNVPKKYTVVLDLGTAIAEDTALLMQISQVRRDVGSHADHALVSMRLLLAKHRQRLLLLDSEFTRAFEERASLARTC